MVSLAVPLGGTDALSDAVASAYGVSLPRVGQSAVSQGGKARFLGLSQDQFFVLLDGMDPDVEQKVNARLGGAAYSTDQTHVWSALAISGPMARRALERICPIDLHPLAFPEGALARTVMEHMGAMIIRTGENDFLLLSAASSARSFLHAVETSVNNVV